MRPARLDLAADPFVNARPVRRATTLLWLLGVALLAANVWLYWGYFSGQGAKSERLGQLEPRLELERLRQELDGLDLAEQNVHVAFLNTKIAQRAFSWSSLFDRLAEVLPAEVHLRRLNPRFSDPKQASRRGSALAPREELVQLELAGVAKSDQALLAFIDAIFAHPAFREPNLVSEARREGGNVEFSLGAVYLPAASAAAEGGEAGGTPLEAAEEVELEEVLPPVEAVAGGETASPRVAAGPGDAGPGDAEPGDAESADAGSGDAGPEVTEP